MRKLIKLSALAGLTLAGIFVQRSEAATEYVGNCLNGFHNVTIQQAINAAGLGGTVDVCPGTYYEQISITQKVTLIGIPNGVLDSVVILPPAGGLVQNGSDIFGNPVAAQIFVQNASSVIVSHLTVDATGNNLAGCGTNLEGIYFQNSSGKITDNVVRNQFQTDFTDYGGCQNGLAINVESLTNSNSVTVSDNFVQAYQKNGITATGAATGAGSDGPTVTVLANQIVGLAATAQNWPGGAAENGIQVGFGAKGTVTSNTVNDNIWYADNNSQPYNAASGILVYASSGITISTNNVGSAQFGITTDSDPSYGYGPADDNIIRSNKVQGTQIFDAIDVCSSGNTVTSNTIYGSTESAIHFDDSCGSGNNNTASSNTINGACAGILLGTGTGNVPTPNTFLNVGSTTLAGDTCTPAPSGDAFQKAAGSSGANHHALRPSPYKPNKIK